MFVIWLKCRENRTRVETVGAEVTERMQHYNTTGAHRGGDLFGQQQVAMPVVVVVTGAQWLDTDGDGDDDDDGHCSTERL